MATRRDLLKAGMAAALGSAALSRQASAASEGATPAGKPLIIDSHVHVFERNPAYPFGSATTFPTFVPPTVDATPETLLALMKANDVARTVLIQHICYKWDNSYLADVLKRYPAHFKGVCRVNPEDPAAPDHLSMWVQEKGFNGVRISPFEDARFDWIRGPLMPPLWQRCQALKVPMTVLTDHSRLQDVMRLVEKFPDLTVVIDHMADIRPDHPEQLAALLAFARYPKVFVKISHMWSISDQPYPYRDSQDQVKRLLDAFGARRLMWGTDHPVSLPNLPYEKSVALFRDQLSFLSEADRQQILGKTVQEVWPFGLTG
ncbi:amidohydrolase family protein [Herbaspirillum sp. NPDC087042]|uniref:amidohydrolase family protein n=1 Tax=Herbaspirillum sp. NPDC087042 TaxID=3364004 RepID=UPI00380D35FC